MSKKKIGKLLPRYSFFLNPYKDIRFSKCPLCEKLTAMRKFALFIPLAIGNGEQLPNAQHLADLGRARVISQKEFTSSWLIANIDSLLASSHARGAQVSTVNSTAHEKITALMQNVLSSH